MRANRQKKVRDGVLSFSITCVCVNRVVSCRVVSCYGRVICVCHLARENCISLFFVSLISIELVFVYCMSEFFISTIAVRLFIYEFIYSVKV